ncbi:hypothetical protein [Endozoicomonas sp. YOMI1]|nr:hypothetical protein [Endozoicomonas sp. YOMI1]
MKFTVAAVQAIIQNSGQVMSVDNAPDQGFFRVQFVKAFNHGALQAP